MIKLGETIIEDGINIKPNKKRQTVRAIILKDKKVLMLYSKLFNDYTFPGGGIKEFEDHASTLSRELLEEVGAKEIKAVKPFGFTTEIKYGINSYDNIYEQTSYYYLVEAQNFTKPSYVGREKHQGLKPVFINYKKAIKHNEKIYKKRLKNDEKGFKTVILRDNLVLKYIGEQIEKIWINYQI